MFEIRSAAFGEGREIPVRHTCEGDDLSPPLGDLGTPTRARLDAAMRGHVLAQATAMGTYEKRRP